MTDLALVALGFGLLPFLAVGLLAVPKGVGRHEPALWGLLLGVVAFLGLAHAGSALLEGNAYLRFETSPFASALVAAAGLAAGIGLGWRLLGRASGGEGPAPSLVVWAAAAFVAVHSFTDGLVLGEGYAGPAATGYPLGIAVVGGTVLHRFAEGALILLPAILASWRPSKATALLLVGLLTVPGAYVPATLLGSSMFSPSTIALEQAIAVFGAGLEAGFATLFFLLGLLPRVRGFKDARWAVWAGLGFTLMLLVHFLVE